MLLHKVYDFLDTLSPFCIQESWDNSGLLVGEMNDDVYRVYISL